MSNSVRTILHVDMDAFFVSVEELFNPELKGKAVVVGGRPDQRGVVSAASYEARKFGVHSAMPLRTAYLKCPHAIFVEGHPDRYSEYSHRVFDVLNKFSPQVSMASIDEAYVDLTGTSKLHGNPMRGAHALHEAVKTATKLNCSIGVSQSRLVSKVASDQAKPNGVLWIMPGQEASFLGPLDVRKIPGVGKVTEKNLALYGIRKVRDLAALDEDFLLQRFGKLGLALAGKSHGFDAGAWFKSDIGAHEDARSVSHEHTFNDDVADIVLLDATLTRLAEKVCRRLRDQNLFARNIHIKLRYSDFSTFTRSKTLDHGTNIDTEIAAIARELFHASWKRTKIRLLGVYAAGFREQEGQLSLLDAAKNDRWKKALSAVDKIRDKFGESSVALAGGMRSNLRRRVHENPEDLPGKPASKAKPTGKP